MIVERIFFFRKAVCTAYETENRRRGRDKAIARDKRVTNRLTAQGENDKSKNIRNLLQVSMTLIEVRRKGTFSLLLLF